MQSPTYKLHFNPTKTHPHIGNGIQRIYHFENGYGASVIPEYAVGIYDCPIPNRYKLAVIKLNTNGEHVFIYDTPITDDVLRILTDDEVQATLAKIAAL